MSPHPWCDSWCENAFMLTKGWQFSLMFWEGTNYVYKKSVWNSLKIT